MQINAATTSLPPVIRTGAFTHPPIELSKPLSAPDNVVRDPNEEFYHYEKPLGSLKNPRSIWKTI